MNDIMPDDFQPPPPMKRKEVMKPAIATARANPMKWVLVTVCGHKQSASTQVSKLRKPDCIQVRSGLDFRHDDATIYVMYDPSKDEFTQAAIPEDAPGLDDPSIADPPPLDPPDGLS